MNDHKISLIMCCNNDLYLNESLLYLDELIIPEGFEIDLVEIRGAESMCAGYNEGMEKSDAKYKIYMHQDVFITNKNFLIDLIDLFNKDVEIGMVGMVGTPYMCKNAIMWSGIRYGGFYKLHECLAKKYISRFFPMEKGYMEMEAVDGLLIATQYDIRWREDLFKKWDFYDVSQSYEFIKAGLKVVVPGQAREWYIHDCGMINLHNYDDERRLFLKEYASFMKEREKQDWNTYLDMVRKQIKNGYHGPNDERNKLIEFLSMAKEI